MTTALDIERATCAPCPCGLQELGRRAAPHLFILPSFAIVLVVLAWFITYGDWRFFQHEHYGTYYDAQAWSILHGRFDVDPQAIGAEAFIRDGKVYSYLGVTPALLRIPLNLLFPDLAGRWSRVLTLIASAIGLTYGYRVLHLACGPLQGETIAPGKKALYSLFVVGIGLGSSNLFIASRSHMFHEALMWGSSLSLAFCYYLLRYLRDGSTRLLAIAGFFCVFAMLSRATTGAGTVLALLLLCGGALIRSLRRGAAHSRTRAIVAATAVLFALGCHFAVSYAKFHSLDGVPVHLYQQYVLKPERMQHTGGRQIHFCNIRTTAYNYFRCGGLVVGRSFPWFFMRQRALIFPEAVIDVLEPFCSIPASMPALFALGCAGLCGILGGSKPEWRRMRLPVAAMWAGGSVILFTVGITERYVHDFFPLLVLCSAAGAARLAALRRTPQRIGITLLAMLMFVGIAINTAFALEFQRDCVSGIPAAKQQEFRHWRDQIDTMFYGRPLHGDRVASWLLEQ